MGGRGAGVQARHPLLHAVLFHADGLGRGEPSSIRGDSRVTQSEVAKKTGAKGVLSFAPLSSIKSSKRTIALVEKPNVVQFTISKIHIAFRDSR